MKINTIGVVLSYYREKYHLPLAEICEGICSATTLFRMEQGYREVDSLVSETLLARIGKQVLEFELLLNEEDYQLFLLRTEMSRRIEEDRYGGIEELLERYRTLMPQKQPVHKQFCSYVEVMCMQKRNAPEDGIATLLKEAIELTKPKYGRNGKKFELYSEVELKLVFLLAKYEKDEAWKEKELLKMLNFIEKYDSKKVRERIKIHISMELIQVQKIRQDNEKFMEYLDMAIRQIAESRKLTGLAELHFEKAKAMERLFTVKKWEKPEEKTEYIRQYREEIKMAYYTAMITEEKELLAEIKEYGGEMQYGKL